MDINNDQIKFSFDERLKMSTVVIDDVILSLKSGTLEDDEKQILDNIQSYLYKSRDNLDLISTKGEPKQELLKFKTAFFYINLWIDEINKILKTKFLKNPDFSTSKFYRYKVLALEIDNLNRAFLDYQGLLNFPTDLDDENSLDN